MAKFFLPKGTNPLAPALVTCFYQYVDNGFEFGLGFSNNSNGLRGITICLMKFRCLPFQKEKKNWSIYLAV